MTSTSASASASASATGPGASASDIRFCDQCAESIPASDFEAGRAITADGRHYHQGCAIARSLTISGPRSWFSLGLALYAAGVATFLLVASLGGRTDPETIPATVEARISEVTTAALDAAGREHASRLLEVAEEEGRLRKADVEAYREEVRGALGVITSRLDEYERFVVANNQALQAMVVRNQQELGQVKRALTEVARRAREEATRRAAPPPTEPEPAEPAEPTEREPAEPTPLAGGDGRGGSGPYRDPGHDADVDRWLPRLEDPNENIRFTATLELGRLKDRRAAPALIQVLSRDRESVVRLGAATALGSMGAVDAVPALVEALGDRESDVRIAAKDSLQGITQHFIELDAPEGQSPGRREWKTLQRDWRVWWRDNERVVRARDER